MKTFFTNTRINNIAGIGFLLVIWQLFSFYISSILVPSPINVLKSLYQLLFKSDFYQAIIFTVIRVFAGFLFSLLIAAPLGFCAGKNKSLDEFLLPLITILRSTPIIVIILLLLIWLNSGNVPVAIAVLTMFPILYTTFRDGIKSTPHQYLEMASVFNLGVKKKFRSIYLPSMAPFAFNGISNALGFGWRAVITGEILSLPLTGVGVSIHDAQLYLLVSEVVAWTIVAVSIGFLTEKFLDYLKTHITFLQNGNQDR